MEKLTQLIQTLWSENKLSKEAYAELLNFTNENQSLQLQQTGVIKSVCNSELECPFDFTSRCTIGRCDCKPKQTVL